jgi:hypothetical protein
MSLVCGRLSVQSSYLRPRSRFSKSRPRLARRFPKWEQWGGSLRRKRLRDGLRQQGSAFGAIHFWHPFDARLAALSAYSGQALKPCPDTKAGVVGSL